MTHLRLILMVCFCLLAFSPIKSLTDQLWRVGSSETLRERRLVVARMYLAREIGCAQLARSLGTFSLPTFFILFLFSFLLQNCNYASRTACNKCKAARPAVIQPPPGVEQVMEALARARISGKPGEGGIFPGATAPRRQADHQLREGDWICSQCLKSAGRTTRA